MYGVYAQVFLCIIFFLRIYLLKSSHCDSWSSQNLTQPLHICSQPEKNSWDTRCNTFGEITLQDQDEVGSYEAAEEHSCSQAPWRLLLSPPRSSPAPSSSGWTARKKSWHGPKLVPSFLQCTEYKQENISTKQSFKALQVQYVFQAGWFIHFLLWGRAKSCQLPENFHNVSFLFHQIRKTCITTSMLSNFWLVMD